MKSLKIEIPEGYEICQETSTFEHVKFKPILRPITERVKTVEDAINILGSCEETSTHAILKEHTCDVKAIARQEWIIIVKALNEGWTPNWDNNNEQKWYAWWDLRNKKRNLDNVRYYYCSSDVPPSEVFKSKELCNYAISQFSNVLDSIWL
jgi:hypothetical protein